MIVLTCFNALRVEFNSLLPGQEGCVFYVIASKVKGKVRSFGLCSALQPIRSIVPSPLKLLFFTTRGVVYQPDTQRTLLAEEGTIRISSTMSEIYEDCWVLLHAPKLGHGTDYFTSPPKEGMLWIFSAGKIRRLSPGANPRSLVPEGSMLTTRPPVPEGSMLTTWTPKPLISSTFEYV
jgi:hypothetical protein